MQRLKDHSLILGLDVPRDEHDLGPPHPKCRYSFHAIAEVVQKLLADEGYQLILGTTDADPAVERRLLENLGDHGVIMIGPGRNAAGTNRFLDNGMSAPFTVCDNGASELAVNLLLQGTGSEERDGRTDRVSAARAAGVDRSPINHRPGGTLTTPS